MKKRIYWVLAALAVFAGAAVNPAAAYEDLLEGAASSHQCHRESWEPPNSCSYCGGECVGGSAGPCCVIEQS